MLEVEDVIVEGKAYDTVTPDIKERMRRMVILVAVDLESY